MIRHTRQPREEEFVVGISREKRDGCAARIAIPDRGRLGFADAVKLNFAFVMDYGFELVEEDVHSASLPVQRRLANRLPRKTFV